MNDDDLSVRLKDHRCLQEEKQRLETLIEQHEEVKVEAACKRGRYPQQIKRNLAKEYNFFVDNLKRSKFRETLAPNLNFKEVDDKLSACQMKKEDVDSVKNTFSKLASLCKTVPAEIERAQRVEKSYRLHASIANCPSHSVIKYPQTEEDKMATSMTPLRKTPSLLIDQKPSAIKAVVKRGNKLVSSSQRHSQRLSST